MILPLLIAATLLVAAQGLPASPIIREPGAVYLSDFEMKPLRLPLRGATPCYFDTARTRFAGELRFPQSVQIEAVAADGMLRVRGNARQGGVAAWIDPSAVQGIPDGLVDNLRKAEKRRIEVEALIAKNEVALGMTVEEVQRSLGKPQKRTNRASKEGTQQIWEYIKYDLVPQTTVVPTSTQVVINPGKGTNTPGLIVQNTGGLAASTVYIKVPVGTLTVTFRDGIVDALDQSEGTTQGGQVSVVVPPITVY